MGKHYLAPATARRQALAPAVAFQTEHPGKQWVGEFSKLGPLDRRGVRGCIDMLPLGSTQTLFGLFVDDDMNLLAFEKIASGPLNAVRPGIGRLLQLGRECGGTAVILAYAASSDDLSADTATLQHVAGLRSFLGEFELPLLDYLVVGPKQTFGIGSW